MHDPTDRVSRDLDIGLRAVVDTLPHAVLVATPIGERSRPDVDLRVVYANPQMVQLLGEPTEPLSELCRRALSAGSAAWLMAESRRALVEEREHTAAVRLRSGRAALVSVGTAGDGVVLRVTQTTAEPQRTLSGALLGALGHAVAVADAEGRLLVWNEAAEQLFGWPADEVVGHSVLATSGELTGLPTADMLRSALRGREDRADLVAQHRDGRTVPVHVTATPLFDEGGAVAGVIGVAVDLSERWETESRLRASEERMRFMAEHSADMVALLDPEGVVHYVSFAAAAHLGYHPDDLTGTNAFDLVHPDDESPARAVLDALVAAPRTAPLLTLRLRAYDGGYRWFEGRGLNLLDEPAVHAVLVNLHDVTERVAVESQLAHQAMHDPLTGLPNRSLFSDRLEKLVSHAQRHGTEVAVLYWDIDGFKSVNDTLGHPAGDTVLVAAARRALATVRSEDTVARLGGDEFAVCAEVHDEAEIWLLADRLLAALSAPVEMPAGPPLPVSASIGVCLGTSPADRLLTEADAAMYDAKRGGGARVAVRVARQHAGA